MFQLEVDDGRLLGILSNLILNQNQKSTLFNQIGINLVENARLRFSDGVAPSGNSWVPSIRAKREGGQTLLNTGRLRNSIVHNVLSDGVEYGTGIQNNGTYYGKALHYGVTIVPVRAQWLSYKIGGRFVKSKKSVIPARPFVGISDDDKLSVVDIINLFLQKQVAL